MIKGFEESSAKRLRTRLLVCGCLLGLVPAPALAQSAIPVPTPDPTAPSSAVGSDQPTGQNAAGSGAGSRGVEDIVVTAQRRSERLQDVPIAVTALNAGALQAAGVGSAADLAKAIPGLSFNTQLGGLGQPRIRGIGVAASGPGLENPVAIYIDNVYYGAASGVLFDLFDVAQVAVLKGPQGTLFGRNATGGLIQVTTKEPSHTFSADLDGTVGTLQTTGADGYITGGLSKTLAASLAFRYDDQSKGFGKIITTGEDIQTHTTYAARGKLLFEPDTATSFTLSGDYSNRRSADFALHQLGYEFFTGKLIVGGPRDSDLTHAPSEKTQQWGVSLNAQREFTSVRLVSITAYRHTVFRSAFDGDESPVNFINVQRYEGEKQFSQELQLLSIGSRRFTWQAGLFYFNGTGVLDPFATLLTVPGTLPSRVDTYVTEGLDSYAGYGQGTLKLGDATNFTAGLRYTIDKRSHLNSVFFTNAFTSVQTGGGAADQDFKKLTWRFSLDHHFSPTVLGYASYNRGFKSGTFDPQAVPPASIKPEVLDAFEVGLKSDLLDRRLRLNGAAYYYNYKNIQVSQFANNQEFVYSGQGATSYGLDLDVTARVTDRFSLDGGVGLIHGRYGNFPNAYKTVPNPGCAVPAPTCGGNTVSLTADATGNKLQNTPDVTFNVGGTYDQPVSFGSFALAANLYYNGGYYSEPENRLHQNHYAVLDLSLAWSSLNKRYTIRAWAKNATDTVYAAQLAAVDKGDVRTAAPGRIVGVTAGLHF